MRSEREKIRRRKIFKTQMSDIKLNTPINWEDENLNLGAPKIFPLFFSPTLSLSLFWFFSCCYFFFFPPKYNIRIILSLNHAINRDY